MRRVLLLAALMALGGCTGLEELDPMLVACRDGRVQDAGWCGGAPADGGGGGAAAGPSLESTSAGAAWSHTLEGSYDRASFRWDSPGRAQLSWSGSGSGGMRAAVQDAGGHTLYASRAGATAGGELLGGRAGAWTVVLEFDNFTGRAAAELRAA